MSYDTWLESAHLDASERADDDEIRLDEQARALLKDPVLLSEMLFEGIEEDDQLTVSIQIVCALNTGSVNFLRHALYHIAREQIEEGL